METNQAKGFDRRFDIILSKNRIARTLKDLHTNQGDSVPEFIKIDFDEIEKVLGTMNQPTGRDILESNF